MDRMRRVALPGLAAALIGLVWASSANAARRIKVESVDGGRARQAIDTRDGVRLVRQLSKSECRFGDTWGYDRDAIWVDKGCRAEFEVGKASSWPSSGSPAPTGRRVRVESKGGAYAFERTDTRGGVQLERELSRSACHLGDSWGFDSNGIWVDKGCRADFRVGGGQPSGGWSVGGSGLRTVKVESRDGGYAHYRIDTRGGVRLSRRLSSGECRQGRTWGFDPDGIWVDSGCRAEFTVGGGPGSDGSFRRVKVESTDGRRVEVRTDARGGVELLRQLSRTDCVQGRTWGYDRERIWVDQGCRAEFAVY